MKSDDEDLGTLIQRSELPKSASMDAIEARVVAVQEVPPKTALQFYAVRGEDRKLLTSAAALATLRDHAPRKPIGELSEAELLVEVLVLRADANRMRPVYEAAKVWRRAKGLGQMWDARQKLTETIDAAIASEDS